MPHSTSHQSHQLARLVQDITGFPEVRDAFTQVVGWLETTSSVPDEVKCKYDELLNAQHFEIAASDFGWICQNHTCWVSFSSGSLESGINRLVKLWPDFFSLSLPDGHNTGFKLRLTGPKPIPMRVHLENGFSLNLDPRAVMKRVRLPFIPSLRSSCMVWITMTLHWWPKMCRTVGAQMAGVSCLRLMKPEILCGKGLIHPFGGRSAQLNVWRFAVFLSQLWMKFRKVIVAKLRFEETPSSDEVFICRPSFSFFTIMALEVLGASPALRTDLSYGPAELFLRRRVHGTVFQPGAFYSFQG